MPQKLDLRRQWKHLYAPSAGKIEVVEVPEFAFLMIDGEIEPGQAIDASPGFVEAMQALYGAAYTLKFMSKLRPVEPIDFTVMAVEGLWSAPGGPLDLARQEGWRYTLMILQPDHIDQAMFEEALRQLRKKRPGPGLERLRLERFCEGLSMQTMHVGPYADEPRTVERMHAFARENGFSLRGRHHEIYLGDPRRTAPDKLKTVLRQPIEKARS